MKVKVIILFITAMVLTGCDNSSSPVYITDNIDTESAAIEHKAYTVASEENIKNANVSITDYYAGCRQKVYSAILYEFTKPDFNVVNEQPQLDNFVQDGVVYVSKTALYSYCLWEGLEPSEENNPGTEFFTVPIFTKDRSQVSTVSVQLEKNGDVLVSLYESFSFEEDIRSMPDKSFIIMTGRKDNGVSFSFALSEDNEIFDWVTKVNYDISVEGDAFHAAPYNDIAFSFNGLIDSSNLEWLEF